LKWPGTDEEKILREISFMLNYGGYMNLESWEIESRIRLLTFPWSQNDEEGARLHSLYLGFGKQKWPNQKIQSMKETE
jgi:hypothetical protein